MAIAAIGELRAQGRRVPADVAVVGYGDVSLAAHSDRPLTTIRQNGPLAGRLLAENLVQNLRTGAVTNLAIPAELADSPDWPWPTRVQPGPSDVSSAARHDHLRSVVDSWRRWGLEDGKLGGRGREGHQWAP